jgi:hypothetical protein
MSSADYRTIIKQQHRWHREITLLLSVLVLLAVFASGYFLGTKAANTDLGFTPGEAYTGSEQELQKIQQEFEVQRIQGELDRVALGMVRQEIAAQKEQIANLEEGLRFYKGLMAPEEITQGLSLRKLELLATDTSGRYIFRLVAQQEALKHPTLKGTLSIEVFGLQGAEVKSYPLADLSDALETNTITLRFRYFQSIEGELVLPEGFTPRGFRVVAKASSPRKVELREQFPWEVQERFSYVGK